MSVVRATVWVNGVTPGAGGGTSRLASLMCQPTRRCEFACQKPKASHREPSTGSGKRARPEYEWKVSGSKPTRPGSVLAAHQSIRCVRSRPGSVKNCQPFCSVCQYHRMP